MPRPRISPLLLSASLFALPAAATPLEDELTAIETSVDSDPARSLARLDALLPQATDGAQRQRVQLARCWVIAQRQPAQALTLAEQEQAAAGAGRASAEWLACRAFAHDRAGRKGEANTLYDSAIARALSHHSVLARALSLRGELFAARGSYSDAIADLKAALDLQRQLGRVVSMRYTLNALANLYADRNLKDYEQALNYYRQSLALEEEQKNLAGQAVAHFNIASTLESQGKLDAALAEFELTLRLDSAGSPSDIAYDERSVGIVQSKLGRHGEALATLNRALARPGQDAEQIAMIRLSRGAALRRAGRFAEALPDLEHARAFFKAQDNPRFLEVVEDERAQVLAGSGDLKGAYAARNAQMALRQALSQSLLDERTARLKVQMETEQARLSAQALEARLAAADAVRRWQFTALVLAVLTAAALAWVAWRQLATSRRMRDLALTDELTRLPNRRHFMALADSALIEALKTNAPVALAGLDIDHFKKINDRFGHAVGDAVLQRVAHAMRVALRPGDAVGRVGGEEFLVIMRGASLSQAAGAAERLRQAVAAVECSDLDPELKPTISIGVAARSDTVQTLEDLCKAADDALYRAKSNGRNRVETM